MSLFYHLEKITPLTLEEREKTNLHSISINSNFCCNALGFWIHTRNPVVSGSNFFFGTICVWINHFSYWCPKSCIKCYLLFNLNPINLDL